MHSKLTNNLNAQEIIDLKEVAERYKELDEETVFSYLWKMTYDPEYALQKVGLNNEVFLELYKKVRNYIFEEYGKPEILGDPDTYNQELFKALGQDKFAYCFICQKIQNAIYYYSESDLKRIASLLRSEFKNNQFGGLRSLGLTLSEAQFFENYERAFSLIGEIFNQNFNEAFNQKNIEERKSKKENKEEEADNNKLIEIFAKCVENKEDLLKFFECLNDIDDKYNIDFEEFLEDYNLFKYFLHLFEVIKQKEIDIYWLSENMNAIEQLLS